MIAGVSITTLLLVLVAGIGAGFVGYAVGASSLISYPALLAFGIPPVLSNTTNTVGVCGTGIGGLLSARKELKGQGRRVAVYACIGLVGGIIGGLLLLELPAKVFEFAVPPLILFSALIIALNPRKKAAARDAVAQALPQSQQGERAALIASRTANGSLRNDPWWLWVGVSFVGIYSGYFGAAAGTLALAILDLGKIGPFHQINALKTVVGFGANISAAIMFICRAPSTGRSPSPCAWAASSAVPSPLRSHAISPRTSCAPPPCSPASSSPSSLAVAPISKSLWFRSVACDRAAALRNDNFRFLVCRDSSWPGDLRRVCSQAGVP